jgi:hypothetical protein
VKTTGFAIVTTDGDGPVDRDFAQQRHADIARQLFAAASAEQLIAPCPLR